MKKHTYLMAFVLILIQTSLTAQNNSFGKISYNKATNISGKQRMLSQKIAKVRLLKLAGASGSELNKEYNSSLQLFQRNLSILEANSKQSSAKVKSLLKKESTLFNKFKAILINKSLQNINPIIESSNTLLKTCHALVLAIEEDSKYNKEYLNESKIEQNKVTTINKSGKQRMLSQRLCLYYTACRLYRKEKLNYKNICNQVENIFNEMNDTLNLLLISDLNTSEIEENIGKILSLFSHIENNKRDFINNKLPLIEIMNTTNQITNTYNVITGQYTSL